MLRVANRNSSPARHNVDLVSALRTIFGFPQCTGLRINGESQHGPVSDGVDLRSVSRLADERIVFGMLPSSFRRRIFPTSEFGSSGSFSFRRWDDAKNSLPSSANTSREPSPPCNGSHASARKMSFTSLSSCRSKRPRASAVVAQYPLLPVWPRCLLHIGEIDEVVLCEIRVQSNIEELVDGKPRNSSNRLWIEPAIVDQPQLARSFSNEDVAIGEERNAPGMGEILGQHRNTDMRAAFRSVIGPWTDTQCVGSRRGRLCPRTIQRQCRE